jgi:hypothetical protein
MRLWQTLSTEQLWPYHIWRIQHLKHVEMGRLFNYCHWFATQPTIIYYVMKQHYPQFNEQYQKLTFVNSWKSITDITNSFVVNLFCGVVGGHLPESDVLRVRLAGNNDAKYFARWNLNPLVECSSENPVTNVFSAWRGTNTFRQTSDALRFLLNELAVAVHRTDHGSHQSHYSRYPCMSL